jgi:hypothetical protein
MDERWDLRSAGLMADSMVESLADPMVAQMAETMVDRKVDLKVAQMADRLAD